jgi:hypothetical protein
MSSVGGGYGKPPTISASKDNKLNLSGTLDKKKSNKEQSMGGEDTIAGGKAFTLVRQM